MSFGNLGGPLDIRKSKDALRTAATQIAGQEPKSAAVSYLPTLNRVNAGKVLMRFK
jgi:hypothetical protein